MTISISLDLETWGTTPGSDLRSIGACVFDPQRGTIADGPVDQSETPDKSQFFYIATNNPAARLDPSPPPGIREITTNDGTTVYWDGVNAYRQCPLTRNPRTVVWWSEQSDEAQAAFTDPVDLREALVQFGKWLTRLAPETDAVTDYPWFATDKQMPRKCEFKIWSHGAAFDPPILAAAYEAVGLPVPWHYRAPRDTRTLFDAAGIEDHSAWLAKHPGPMGVSHHSLDDSICQARAICAAWQRINVVSSN